MTPQQHLRFNPDLMALAIEWFYRQTPQSDHESFEAWVGRMKAEAGAPLLPTDPADEKLIDELMAKRAEKLETRPMHAAKQDAPPSGEPVVTPQRFTAPEPLPVVGSKVRIVELFRGDPGPNHQVGDVLTVGPPGALRGAHEIGPTCFSDGRYLATDEGGEGGTWVSTVELIEECARPASGVAGNVVLGPHGFQSKPRECPADHPSFGECAAKATECLDCGVRDCPHGEPLHYHHDGCPACSQEPAQPVDSEPSGNPRSNRDDCADCVVMSGCKRALEAESELTRLTEENARLVNINAAHCRDYNALLSKLIEVTSDRDTLAERVKELELTNAELTQERDEFRDLCNSARKLREERDTLAERVKELEAELDGVKRYRDTANALAESIRQQYNGYRSATDAVVEAAKDTVLCFENGGASDWAAIVGLKLRPAVRAIAALDAVQKETTT